MLGGKMRHHYLVWTGQFLVIVNTAFGIWWLFNHIHGMPDYRLFLALTAMTGYVLNHFRWRKLRRKMEDPDLLEKFDHFVVVNYSIFLIIISLVGIRW
jgi:hypothetical protein